MSGPNAILEADSAACWVVVVFFGAEADTQIPATILLIEAVGRNVRRAEADEEGLMYRSLDQANE